MASKQSPLISLDNVSVIFENNAGMFRKSQPVGAALDVSFDVNPGEIIAVVGESGCGKTTIGKTVAGIHKPTRGRLLYRGQDISLLKTDSPEYREYRLGVQMVHQDSYAALNPSRTIFQSLSAPILTHGIATNRLETLSQLVDLFTMVGLTPAEDFLFKYPHQLSGGQRQRTLLARALSVKPKLIVADEPVSMIDVSLRISLLDLMSKMNRELGLAFIYITHDLATARYIVQNGRIIVMYLGRVVETGDLNHVLEYPRHPYLQALLRAIPQPDPKTSRGRNELPLRSIDMPSNINPPPGCRFHPRCPYWTELCERDEPQLRPYEGCMIACHHAENIPEWVW